MAARGLADGISKLPRIKCPRGGTPSPDESPRLQHRSPRTPRRRDGRLSAGAAFSLFYRSPGNSPRAGYAAGYGPGPQAFDRNGGSGAWDRITGGALGHLGHATSAGDVIGGMGGSASASSPLLSMAWASDPRGTGALSSHFSAQHLSSALSSLFPSSRPSGTTISSTSSTAAPSCLPPPPHGHGRSRRAVRTRAAGDGGSGEVQAETRDARLEMSESVNEDMLLFFYQLDLNMRLQRALNQDQYEPAQQLREKIAEVEREIARLRDAKMGGVSAKSDAQDKGITLLSLKAELSRAIEEEQYSVAAELRNKITALESETLAASAAALAARSREFQFRLGQRIFHKVHGYKGVVAGMDAVCCESAEWRDAAGLGNDVLSQPFYQILVDVKEGVGFPVAYVPEASLEAPDEPTTDRFDHPYVYLLFYGMDKRGDFIPCSQLREKYNAPRHEVPEDEGEDGGGEDKSE